MAGQARYSLRVPAAAAGRCRVSLSKAVAPGQVVGASSQGWLLDDVVVVGVDDDRPDEELLVSARRDVEAFGVFYRRRVDAVLAFFLRRTGDRELAAV